jgi:hypothetical protein
MDCRVKPGNDETCYGRDDNNYFPLLRTNAALTSAR